jgi:hypothetical protein
MAVVSLVGVVGLERRWKEGFGSWGGVGVK